MRIEILLWCFLILQTTKNNNQAEALVVKAGVRWCIQNDIDKIKLEIDSQIITIMLNERGTDNLKLKIQISLLLQGGKQNG